MRHQTDNLDPVLATQGEPDSEKELHADISLFSNPDRSAAVLQVLRNQRAHKMLVHWNLNQYKRLCISIIISN